MENFIEYCLPYKMTLTDQLKRLALTVAPMALGVVLIMLLGPIGILLCAGCCYLAYRLFMSFFFEYEITLLENEITFTKIINKERRKEILKADISKTERYGLLSDLKNPPSKIRSFLSHQGEEAEYYWITRNSKDEKVCILFQPNEGLLQVFEIRARGKRE